MLAVADTVDAMLTLRPYRPPLRLEQVLRELHAGSGTQFDPQLVEAFLLSGALDLYDLVPTPDTPDEPGD
ncbi:HD-GYP domain-containing protein [Deinococcus daejeonensis]|uniref:HD-GYP domain-containing protein n=1 Tax=Deinococcus daejeonensis TaxID=1007098 RepID=A0ABQ2JGX7_9DEIO|nr:hypothetical protein [Deinococcus daejeonensis]GGN47322.1 hypothetical protein GCM10010842_38700 [Deinococcus daejeonensis]